MWFFEIVIPKAVEIIERMPVKLPGPHPTTKKVTSFKDIELSCKNILIVGTIISDNSCLNGTDMWLITLLLSNNVSDKSDVLVSIEIIIKIFNQQWEKGSIISTKYIIKL